MQGFYDEKMIYILWCVIYTGLVASSNYILGPAFWRYDVRAWQKSFVQ